VLDVDRMVLLVRDPATLEMNPRVQRTFASSSGPPFSRRVVEWVVEHGGPASFGDVSRDKTLPGDPRDDAAVRSAACVPMTPGGRTIGALYADHLGKADAFRPDDVAVLRALANIAAVAIDRDG
jgi:GAF domain-containing protein